MFRKFLFIDLIVDGSIYSVWSFCFSKKCLLGKRKTMCFSEVFFCVRVLFPKQDLVDMLLLILAKRKILLVVVVVVVVRENLIVLTFFHVI